MRRLKKIGVVLAILYCFITFMAYKYQEKLIFIPTKMPVNHVYDFCQDFEELWINTSDGAKLNGVHIKNNSEKGVVLYFHGNAGNVSHLVHVANLITRKGYDAILVDYRTYGKSTGKLSEKAIYDDAQLFYNMANEKYGEDNIIVYGRSFGGGVASYLAAKNKPCKLILESVFYSAIETGKRRFPFLPITWLSNYKFPSYEYMKELSCPVYMFHGDDDFVVPYKAGKRLYEEIPGDNKYLYTIAGGGHNYLQDFPEFKTGIEKAFQ